MTGSNSEELFKEIKSLIILLRRQKETDTVWPRFNGLVNDKIDQICSNFDTRWLVSIADTYADYGTPIEQRNAMFVSIVVNFEKLWATNLLMYDIQLNQNKLNRLKKNRIIPLWDGMYSFNINHGDMVNNLFLRIRRLIKDTPVIEKIFETVLDRILKNDTILTNINTYHQRLLENPRKISIVKGIIRKIRIFFRNYRLY